MNRRQFLWRTGLAAGLARAQADDPVASSPPARWAMQQLQDALAARGAAGGPSIVAAGLASLAAREILQGVVPPDRKLSPSPPARSTAGPSYSPPARTPAALVYALLELTDRVTHGADLPSAPVIERPANVIRSVTRCFVSDVEDKPWYHDRSSPYPLKYYFELRSGPESAWLYPGFDPDLSNQPYFVVTRSVRSPGPTSLSAP